VLTAPAAEETVPTSTYPVTIFDAGGAPATLTANVVRRVSIDLTSLAANYPTVVSNSRTFPLYIFLANNSNLTQELTKTNSTVYDQIIIRDMNGWFNY